MRTFLLQTVLVLAFATGCATGTLAADDPPCPPEPGVTSRVLDVKALGAIGDGRTDDSDAIAKAIEQGLHHGQPVFFPPGRYVITRSMEARDSKTPLVLYGLGPASVLINRAGPLSPTLVLRHKTHFHVSGLAFAGHRDWPNDAIRITGQGIQRSGYGTLRDLYLYPNGNGIHLEHTNTVDIENVEYWKGSNEPLGACKAADRALHAILADGTGQVNAVSIRFLVTGEWEPKGAAIKWSTDSPSSMISVSDSDLEVPQGTGKTSIDFTRVYKFSLRNNYLDHTALRFVDSRYGDIVNNNAGSFHFGNGTLDGKCTYITFLASNPVKLVADSFCESIGAINSAFDLEGYDNKSKNRWGVAVFKKSSVRLSDELGGERIGNQPEVGIRERGREGDMGEWKRGEHDAGTFTATSGAWNVKDASTFSYTLVGNTMTLTFYLVDTAIGADAEALKIKIPDKREAKHRTYATGVGDIGGPASTPITLRMETQKNEYIYLYPADLKRWPADTKITVGGTFTFEVDPL